MSGFLEFLAQYRTGIAVLSGSLLLLMVLVQWLAWVFQLGRFKVPKDRGRSLERTSQLRFVIADFFVKVIDEFRNLLALLILLIFAVTLAAVLMWAPKFGDVKEGLQAVVAALGGLVGSIIGYYFGESAATAKAKAAPGDQGSASPSGAAPPQKPPVQDPSAPAPDVEEAPLPPGL